MKIGIIGSGNVGGTLGKLWAAKGHEVLFSSRDPQSDKMKKLLADAGSNAQAGSVADAVAFGDVIVLATPWDQTEKTLTEEAGDFGNKVLIDCTNPLDSATWQMVDLGSTSGGQSVAQWAKNARVVKDFNTLGANMYGTPTLSGQKVTMLYCGDDAAAKDVAKGLTEELGFEGIDVGPLAQAKHLEHLTVLWLTVAPPRGWSVAFSLLKP